MKIGVFSTFMSPLATPGMIRDFGRRAEDIGLESIWMGEQKQVSQSPPLYYRNTSMLSLFLQYHNSALQAGRNVFLL